MTKPLLVVSKICEQKKGVYFGPAPKYESFVIDDPEAFVVSRGNRIKINLENGTYNIEIHECYKKPLETIAAVGQNDSERAHASSSSGGPPPNVVSPPVIVDDSGGGVPEDGGDSGLEGDKLEIHDEVPVKVKPNPLKPTPHQIDEHIARGHIPYRSWCEQCVGAGAKEDQHRRVDHSGDQLPVVTCDYRFVGLKDSSDKITLFVFKECVTRSVYACICPRKGTECQVASELFLDARF